MTWILVLWMIAVISEMIVACMSFCVMVILGFLFIFSETIVGKKCLYGIIVMESVDMLHAW